MRPPMPPSPLIPPPHNRGGGKPKPPNCRHEYQTILGIYRFMYPFGEMKAIMKSKTLTGDMWRLGQAIKRLNKVISKTWGVRQILKYLR